jgi:hypothetical protein
LVEQYPCENKKQLLWRERHWITELNAINKSNPIVSVEEKQARIKKESDKHNAIYSKLEPIQCECGGTYTYKHKTRHLSTEEHRLGVDEEYRKQKEAEKEAQRETSRTAKQEYKANWAKEHRSEYREKYAKAELIQCECGHSYHPKQKKYHLSSVQHRMVTDAEFRAEREAEKEEAKRKAREYKTNWEREKRAKQVSSTLTLDVCQSELLDSNSITEI